MNTLWNHIRKINKPHYLEIIDFTLPDRLAGVKKDLRDKFHLCLTEFSKEAHEVASIDNQEKIKRIEEEIDEAAAKI